MLSPVKPPLRREPQQARSKKVVEKICRATLKVSRTQGLSALNTNLIAQVAGVDISSVYRFFPNKDSIIHYILEQWLGDIRDVWDRFETDPELLKLPWQAYFLELSREWQVPGTAEKYSGLAAVWAVYPDLRALDTQHREYFIDFFIRQMKRFGARGNRRQWRDLAVYLYVMEDEVHMLAATGAFSTLKSGRALFLDTMVFLLGRQLR
jgi:AcrR family transcriptional regulator